MGNTVRSSTASIRDKFSSSPDTNLIDVDTFDLHALDENKSHLKEDKSIRKTKEYKQLRALARQGIDDHRRFQLWQKGTNAVFKYSKMYDTISIELFEDVDMEEFPHFPQFGSLCEFNKLLPIDIESLRSRSVGISTPPPESSPKMDTSQSLKVPTFYHQNQELQSKSPIARTNKVHEAQRILLILAIEHDSLKYCPQLPYVVERMLLDPNATEAGVFAICHSMLVASKRNNWYFRTDYFNSYVRIKTFLSIFADNVSTVSTYLEEHNMDISNTLGDAISSMFVDYLNEETYLRLMDIFTVEGYKILFRVGVALIKNAAELLVKCDDLRSFQAVLIEESRKLKPDALCQLCFKLYLKRNKFEKLDQKHRDTGFDDKTLNAVEEESYVRRWPTWNKDTLEQSQVLTKKVQFLQLWVWLPPGCHVGDYNLLFSTETDGYKLSELYRKCQEQTNLIIVIKTTRKEIIGVFVSQLDDPDKIDSYAPLRKRITDTKMLLFQLYKKGNFTKNAEEQKEDDPTHGFEPQCFWADTSDQFYHQSNFQLKNMHTSREALVMSEVESGIVEIEAKEDVEKENEQRIPVVFPSKDALIVGDGVDNCIYIDTDLNHGFSSKCRTFKSPCLVTDKEGAFQVSQVEVWCVE